MALDVVTAATNDPVTLAAAKSHLRIDSDEDDQLILALIETATLMVEQETKRAISQRTYDFTVDHGWPYRNGYPFIYLPVNPVQSVTSITYINGSSPNPTLSSSLYTVKARNSGSFIVPEYNVTWPDVRNVPEAVTVRFIAGYATSEIPGPLIHAIKVLIGYLYEHRGDENPEMPRSVEALISPYRITTFSRNDAYTSGSAW